MKFADRLKFTATGTSAATITVGAAVNGFLTLAQSIADSASKNDPLGIKVGDMGVPFTIDDGAGNEETSLFTVASTTVLTRTSVVFSSAGGTTPATFANGATLNVYSGLHASFASRLVSAAVDTLGNFVGLKDPKGNDINLIARLLANANTPASPAVEKTFKVIDVIRVTNNTGDAYPDRQVYAEAKRKSITFKNPVTNTVSFEIGSRKADNIQNPNPPVWSGSPVIGPGQECVVFFDDSMYWVRQSAATTTADQFMTIEREVRV